MKERRCSWLLQQIVRMVSTDCGDGDSGGDIDDDDDDDDDVEWEEANEVGRSTREAAVKGGSSRST